MTVTDTPFTDTQRAALNAAHKVAEVAGIATISDHLYRAVDAYQDALRLKREARQELDLITADHQESLALAEMEAGALVIRESNKTYLPGDGAERRQVTADEARTWVAQRVAADPQIKEGAGIVRGYQLAYEAAADAVAVADRRISATKHSCDAAVALTQLLTTVLGGTPQ